MTLPVTPAVEARQLRKAYGSFTAVHDVDLTVGKGELVTLLGPSGCGKTTILRMIAGFVTPDSGSIAIAGKSVNALPPHKRHVGLMFQNYALFPHMSVGENVAFGLRMRSVGRAERDRRVHAALEAVRLDGRIDAYPRQLSGGQQQRVALARALVIEPDILLLDEPLGALDRELRQHLQGEMKRLQRSLGISTLLVTHDQEEALMLSDRIAVMNGGRSEQVASPSEIFERPRTKFVARFMGGTNIFDGTIRSDGDRQVFVLSEGRGTLLLPARDRLPPCQAVMVRPEGITLAPVDSPAVATEARMMGRIEDENYLGATSDYSVRVDGTTDLVLVVRRASNDAGPEPYRPGQPVSVSFAPKAIHPLEQR